MTCETWFLFGNVEILGGGGDGILHRTAGELEYSKCLVFPMNEWNMSAKKTEFSVN